MNNKGRKEPEKSEEELYQDLLISPWLKETCRKNNLDLGFLGNVGFKVLDVIGIMKRAEEFFDRL